MYKHRLHEQHYHLTAAPEIKKLAINISLGTIAGSLIGIFVPIYLYKLGYSTSTIFIYFAAMGLVASVVHMVSAYLLRWIGGNRLIVLSDLSDSLAFALLATLPHHHWPIFLMAFFKGVGKGLYWPAYHAAFSKRRSRMNTGRQISAVGALLIVAGSLAPALGGVLGSAFGLSVIYWIGIALMLFSALPLLVGEDQSKGYITNFSALSLNKYRGDYVAGFCYTGASIVETIVWPLAIYLLVKNYTTVGLLSATLAVASIAVTLYVGARSQSLRQKNYINKSSLLNAAASALRIFASTPPFVFAVNFTSGISDALIYTPFTARYYNHADQAYRVEYVTGMEIARSIAWAVICLFLAGVSLVLSLNGTLVVGLILGVPLALGFRAMR